MLGTTYSRGLYPHDSENCLLTGFQPPRCSPLPSHGVSTPRCSELPSHGISTPSMLGTTYSRGHYPRCSGLPTHGVSTSTDARDYLLTVFLPPDARDYLLTGSLPPPPMLGTTFSRNVYQILGNTYSRAESLPLMLGTAYSRGLYPRCSGLPTHRQGKNGYE